MTLVERFIEVNDWPTCRKTVLLMGIALPAQVVVSVIGHFLVDGTQIADMALFDAGLIGGVLAVSICLVLSLLTTIAGKKGDWTAYLVVALYGAWITVFVQLVGSWSTPLWAMFPLAVLLVALYYGERVGLFTFFFALVILIFREVLEENGVLPYAPALLDRSIDAHRNLNWVVANALFVGAFYVLCFVLNVLVVAARTLQNSRLRDAQQQLELSNRLIGRYVPSQLAARIISGQYSESGKPERTKLTIFFSDVEGFTDASDQLDAEELAAVLNEYLAEMAAIADRYGATINQFVGDGIMIFFGAPESSSEKDHALRAVRMGLDMQSRLLELKNVWVQRGIRKPFRARIGINTGYASVGDYGSPGRKMYSAIGLQTNLAARIQVHCDPGKILISDTTWALVREEFACTDKGEFTFKGLHYPVRVYEVSVPSEPLLAT